MKKYLSLLLIIAMLLGVCLSVSSCTEDEEDVADQSESQSESESESESDTEKQTEDQKDEGPSYQLVKDNLDKFNIVGRCPVTDMGAVSGWSASGIEFRVKGSGDVYIVARSETKAGEYLVYVDGKAFGVVRFPTYVTTATLGLNLKDEEKTIGLYRITNNEEGMKAATTIFTRVGIDGEICEYKSDKKLIEFVGDSITCGYGLHRTESGKAFDGTRAYTFTLAQKLGYEHSVLSTSGIGVYLGSDRNNTKGNMSVHYDCTNYLRSTSDKYATEDKKADIVVINLNTNDNDHGGNDSETEYKNAVRTLIGKVRNIHGNDAKVVWVVGMMRPESCNVNDWMKEILNNELGGEANGYYVVSVTQDNSGGGDHPSYAAHNVVVEEIEAFLKQKNLV